MARKIWREMISSSKPEKGLPVEQKEAERFDFEREARAIIDGIKRERRWRSRSKGNILDKFRRFLAVILLTIADLVSWVARWVDSWRAGPENVLEHSFKQTLQVAKMLRIEAAEGNPHQLDFYRILEWSLHHDLAEGQPDFSDIHFHDKRKSEAVMTRYKNIEKAVLLRLCRRLMPEEYRNCVPEPLDMDRAAPKPDKVFWEAAEHISHCYFMLEEVRRGRIDKKRRNRFIRDVPSVHLHWMINNAFQFKSVRAIVLKELSPKWRELNKH